MYNCVYAAMVDAKLATPLEESYYYFIKRAGCQINTEKYAAVQQIKHRLSHPQYVLFRYELGTDNNLMEDSNNRGQRYISVKGNRTNLLLSRASGRFTLIGMTAPTGEPVLCIYILAANILIVTDVKWFDYRTSIPYDSSKIMEENMGELKGIPGFSLCKFRGKLIPGLMCMSPKVSVVSEILTEALKYLDHLNVF